MRPPSPKQGGDKEERGRVLVIGGGRELPGAVILTGTAALRAGAGKLQIATAESVAAAVAASVPESRVFALPETRTGSVALGAVKKLEEHIGDAQSVCVGPGMIEEVAVTRFVKGVLKHCVSVAVVLDAGAVACLAGSAELLRPLRGRAVLTPNAEEMANILGLEIEEVKREPLRTARRAADELGAVVVLKGRETFIVGPGGETYSNRAGNVGLATSGSGDVLSGIIAGFVARGAAPLDAAAWGVYVHALAGDRLAEITGGLGFLARELLGEIPRVTNELDER